MKVFEEFDGDYTTNSKRHRRDEQVEFRLLVYSKEKVRRKSLVEFARATNLDLPKREVLDLYNKVRGPRDLSPEHQGVPPLHQFHQVCFPHLDLRAGPCTLLLIYHIQGGGGERGI